MRTPRLKAFTHYIRPFVVEIRTRWQPVGEKARQQTGTGTIVSRLRREDGRLLCVVATAKHVLPPSIIHDALDHSLPERRPALEYRITRSLTDHPRTVTLRFGPNVPPPEIQTFIHSDASYDGALFAFPSVSEDGSPFIDEAEQTPKLFDPRKIHDVGAPIAWAGYPALARDLVGHQQVCYYEGRISATINRAIPLYLADGHVSYGVSGGPVWSADDGAEFAYGLIGLVTSYQGETDVPGLCVFTPLNPLAAYLRESQRAEPSKEPVQQQAASQAVEGKPSQPKPGLSETSTGESSTPDDSHAVNA